ncbi:hypothetical protein QQW93_06715 [Pasteurella multocida]|uniref:hypothetical protein n=1 Tax=Pasteurella multocida TaxID=747 RepID=UPI00099CDC01|nr:hypothetical protein [Pasteurella multocida]MCL7825080.1 hypothetical protein [Pasteurella multocida]MCL7829986.1 hypothetical protein [Pasteurella multocida]MCL7833946.1 hypothetical protein [Pasteurella multocida]MDY0489713.1 hypothetical protein [Pasteurella multocida]MDY0669979.1 hypothetical protein [Pasteurella multocida]
MRKIIQICESTITSSSFGDAWNLSALCDDGSLWCFNGKNWGRLPDIPQDNVLNVAEPLRPIFNASETKDLKWVYRVEQPSAYRGYEVLKVAARNVSDQKYKFGCYYKTREEAVKAIELITGMDFETYSKIKYRF